MAKLTDEFLRHIKSCGITADNKPISIFFEHQDGTIITIPINLIIENEEIVDRLKERVEYFINNPQCNCGGTKNDDGYCPNHDGYFEKNIKLQELQSVLRDKR